MGIPYLIKSLLAYLDEENNKKLTMPFYRVQGTTFHSLYFDFNSFFYKAYAKVAGLKPESFILQEQFAKHLSKAQIEELIIEETLKLFTEVLKMFTISHLLYIGIDGVVPNAKMVQQRQRRFRTADEKENTKLKAKFDTNAFSPGTTFMKHFDDKMKEWIDTHGFEISPIIVYSSHLTPSEAEHKIMSHLRKNIKADEKIGIYGLDGDLLMLSLLSPAENITLLREDINQVILIQPFRNAIYNRFKEANVFNQLEYNQAIRDFVLLMSIFGNDFLMKPVALSDINLAIKIIMEKRSEIKQPISNADGSFILSRLLKIYSYLKEEDFLLAKAKNQYVYPDPFLDETVTFADLTNVEQSQGGQGGDVGVERYPMSLNYNKYRSLWYNNLLKSTASVVPEVQLKNEDGSNKTPIQLSELISDVIKSYFITIAWMFRYYTQGTRAISQTWFYPYTNVPLLKDILGSKLVYEQLGLHYRDKLETNPVIQLLVILPPSSKLLIGSLNMRSFMTDPLLESYYRDQFSIQRFGTNDAWQGTAIISPASIKRVEAVINQRLQERKLHNGDFFTETSLASALVSQNAINAYQYETNFESYKLEKQNEENRKLVALAKSERQRLNREERQSSKPREQNTFFNPSNTSNNNTSSQSANQSKAKVDTSNRDRKDKKPNVSKSQVPLPEDPKIGASLPTPNVTIIKPEAVKLEQSLAQLNSSLEKNNNEGGGMKVDEKIRLFNNWVKSMVIQEATKINKSRKNQFSVLELDSRKGVDLKKWLYTNPKVVILTDASEKNLQEAKSRYEAIQKDNPNLKMKAEFFKDTNDVPKKSLPVNIVSVPYAMETAFESQMKAEAFFNKVNQFLKEGGVMIATIMNPAKISLNIKSKGSTNVKGSANVKGKGQKLYDVKFEKPYDNTYGAKYQIRMGRNTFTEFVVPIEKMKELALIKGFEVVEVKNFVEFANDYGTDKKYKDMRAKMQVPELSDEEGELELASYYMAVILKKIAPVIIDEPITTNKQPITTDEAIAEPKPKKVSVPKVTKKRTPKANIPESSNLASSEAEPVQIKIETKPATVDDDDEYIYMDPTSPGASPIKVRKNKAKIISSPQTSPRNSPISSPKPRKNSP